jgi:hypothetical protein
MQLELDCLNSGVYCSNTWKNEREKKRKSGNNQMKMKRESKD